MEIEKRKEVASYLKWGDIKMISDKTGVHRTTIHLWLTGKVNKSSAEPIVVAFANKRKEQLEKLIKDEIPN